MTNILVWNVTLQSPFIFTWLEVPLLQVPELPADLYLFSLNSFIQHLSLTIHFLALSQSTEFCLGDHPITGLQLFTFILPIFSLILSWDRELQRCVENVSCDQKLMMPRSLVEQIPGFTSSELPDRTIELQFRISSEKKKLTGLSDVLKRSCLGSHSSQTKSTSGVRHFEFRRTARVVSIDLSSVVGGPSGVISKRENPFGVKTSRRALAVSNVPPCETSSVSERVRGVSGIGAIRVTRADTRDVAGRTSGGSTSRCSDLSGSRGVDGFGGSFAGILS